MASLLLLRPQHGAVVKARLIREGALVCSVFLEPCMNVGVLKSHLICSYLIHPRCRLPKRPQISPECALPTMGTSGTLATLALNVIR